MMADYFFQNDSEFEIKARQLYQGLIRYDNNLFVANPLYC